ncbi:DUF3800 domain-containing protein [Sphingomonas bisphenolicum]
MRLVYVDEAGTSANEPVRVVSSVIVHGDEQHQKLRSELNRLIKHGVPNQFQKDFIIHAKDIFNGGKYRGSWEFKDRLDFLKEIACLPFCFDVPIAVGVVFSGCDPLPSSIDGKIARNVFEHILAFAYCIERSDYFLRTYLDGSEVGTVIAEDVPKIRKLLSLGGVTFREHPMTLSSDDLKQNRMHKLLNLKPTENSLEIRHIIDVPHFVEKAGAPLLQLADVCAFSFRRCLSRQTNGDDLVLAMLGPIVGPNFLKDEVWFSEISSGIFNTDSYLNPDQKAENASLNLALEIAHLLKPPTS